MNTYLNLSIEFPPGKRGAKIKSLLSVDLMVRISSRGQREQYAAILQPHLNKHKIKGSYIKNNVLHFM